MIIYTKIHKLSVKYSDISHTNKVHTPNECMAVCLLSSLQYIKFRDE